MRNMPVSNWIGHCIKSFHLLEIISHSLHLFAFSLTMILDGNFQDIWESVSELLMNLHPWICTISSRLIALYFATRPKDVEWMMESSY